MNTELTLNNQTMKLFRYPPESQHKNLQAWDSADELLIQYVAKHEVDFKEGITILNDDFGALAVFLQGLPLTWYSDSKVAQLSLQHNFSENQLSIENLTVIYNLSSLESDRPVLMRLPKSNEFLKEILIHLRQSLPAGTNVIVGGKTTSIHTSTLKLFEQHLGETKTTLARKKSRLIISKVDKNLATTSPFPKIWSTPDSGIKLFNYPNVFAGQQLDIGARLMLQHLPDVQGKSVIDLGCGNGVLGLHCLLNSPKALHFVDESYDAIRSAKSGVEELLQSHPELQSSQTSFYHSNCLENADTGKVNVIVCNPPFHQQQTITDHIAWQMFVDAKESLQQGGELRIVGNRHLNYHDKLKRLFGGYKLVASNNKFVVLSSKKR